MEEEERRRKKTLAASASRGDSGKLPIVAKVISLNK